MSDRIRTVDMSNPDVVLDCYRKLNVAYKELKAENEKLHGQAAMNGKLLTENAELREQLRLANIDCFNQEADNKKLRAALEPFTGYAIDDETPDDEYTSLEGLTVGQLRAAADALKETGE